MKVLLLTRYGRKGASSRLRFLQYLPYLESRGISIEHQALLGDDYLASIYAGERPSYLEILRSGLSRIKSLLHASRFDLVWIEAELFPFVPAVAERWLRVPYVVDYDDATFHRYDRHRMAAIRRLLGDKIDIVMRHAALVVAGNEYLADRARRADAPRVERLPTVVDLNRYSVVNGAETDFSTVGWIGTPITSMFLEDVATVVRELGETRLVALGGSNRPDVDVRPWSEDTEAGEIARFDVGIMPLPDNDWERGKCGYKLIQYMACGKPVVASPVGINKELVIHGENGFLATTTEEWRSSLEKLKQNAHLRKEMGERGRLLVEDHYCTAVTAPRLEDLLRSAIL